MRHVLFSLNMRISSIINLLQIEKAQEQLYFYLRHNTNLVTEH